MPDSHIYVMKKKDYLSEEAIIVRNSGEIPEVTYHGSIYYLTKDPEGPGLTLDNEDLSRLKDEVIQGYRTILLRDMTLENRNKGLYRGLARSIANWQRLYEFSRREEKDVSSIRSEAADALKNFLHGEISDVQNGSRASCINCSASGLEEFAKNLGIDPDSLPSGWLELCQLWESGIRKSESSKKS